MIQRGDVVEVVRGRKVPIGTRGTVKWTGETQFGPSVGFVPEGEEDEGNGLTFVDAKNVEKVGSRPATPGATPRPAQPEDARVRLAACESARLRAEDEVKALRVERDALKALAEAQSGEILALRAKAPSLDAAFLTKVAEFAGQKAREAVWAALATKLAKPAPAPEATKPEAPANGVPRARVLDLGDEPSPLAKPSGDASDADHVDPRTTTRHEDAERTVARALAKPQDAPAKPAPAPAPLQASTRPEAPQAAPAPRLGKCPRCKRFAMGKHECGGAS